MSALGPKADIVRPSALISDQFDYRIGHATRVDQILAGDLHDAPCGKVNPLWITVRVAFK
jgi:hypothetical protein